MTRPPTPLAGLALMLALLLAACERGAGPEAAFQRYQQAIRDRDPAALAATMTEAEAAEVADAGAAMIGLAAALAPEAPEVTEVEIDGSEATLTLSGARDGMTMEGTAELVRENGTWKIRQVSWNADLRDLDLIGDRPTEAPEPVFTARSSPPRSPALTLTGHGDAVSDLVFTADRRYLVSACYGDFTLRVWDLSQGRQVHEIRTESRVNDIDIDARRRVVAGVDVYGALHLWKVGDGRLDDHRTISTGLAHGFRVAISSDGTTLAMTNTEPFVSLWDAAEGRELRRLDTHEPARGVAFSASGMLAVGGYERTLHLWPKAKGRAKRVEIPKVMDRSDVQQLAFSPAGELIATAHMDSSITLWQARQRDEVANFYVEDAATWDVDFSPDGSLFATAHANGSVYLWKTHEDGGFPPYRDLGDARCVAFDDAGTMLAAGLGDGRIVVWGRPPAEATPSALEEAPAPPAESS